MQEDVPDNGVEGEDDGEQIENDAFDLGVLNHEHSAHVEVHLLPVLVLGRVLDLLRGDNVSHQSEQIVARVLEHTGQNHLQTVVLGVVNVAVLTVSKVQT